MEGINNSFSSSSFRPGTCESTRRCLHQWSSPAQSHSPEDRRNGCSRSATLCHLQAVASLARMRLEDLESVPGDRLNPSRSYWRIKAEGGDARHRGTHRIDEAAKPKNIQLGDPREISQGKRCNNIICNLRLWTRS